MARWGSRDGRRRLALTVVGAVVFVLVAFTLSSGFYLELLWFREVGNEDVFWTTLRTKAGLGLVFGLAFAAILWVNLVFVRRLTPKYRVLSPEQEIIERYRVAFEPYLAWGIPAFAAVLGLFVGIGTSTRWQTFLLWRNGSGALLGVEEPVMHRDVTYYLFTQPWLKFVQGWIFSSLVGITIIAALGHYVWGNIRPQAVGEKVSPQVKAHLSVLLGLTIFAKAWGYWLERFDLLTSPRGVVTGASYTDVHAQLPALTLLVFIALVCGVLFLVNIRNRGWALPVLGVGLLALSSVVIGTIYPAAIQRFRVDPQELQNEGPFIERNIEFTRSAFGLDVIGLTEPPLEPRVAPEDLASNATTIQNIRLWRPDVLEQNFKSLQRIRQYYEFNDVDVDRYVIEGERRVVMVSAREISQNGIPAGGGRWQNRHLIYTHGFGAVASAVNTATTEGAPLFTLRDIPPFGEPDVSVQPRVYYGEAPEEVPFVLVNTKTSELDYEGGPTGEQRVEYDGEGGIGIGSLLRRAMFALRFRDVNLLLSNQIDDGSRIMIYRDIATRVQKVAPFLVYDRDPYVAIVNGRIVWIWDAYTVADTYPYSQQIDLAEPTAGDLSGEINYIRNSVKVVIDAYDGAMKFYVSDPDDPIVRAWQGAFPELFSPVTEADPELLSHFRYPENLLQIQATQYANYHVLEPEIFFQKQDFWAIPQDPTVETEARAMRPYYLLMKLPGEVEEEFVLVLPFTPIGRQNMVAWMAARSDWGQDYGEIVAYKFPPGRNVYGPTQVFSQINQDPTFSSERTLLGQSGSEVRFGDFLVIPIEQSMLYVQPVYIQSKQQENAIPELKRVIVVNGETVGLGDTLAEALADAVGAEVPGGGEVPGDGGEEPTGGEKRVEVLLRRALEHFAAADEALAAGDLATYQREIEVARDLIERATELAKGAVPSPEPGVTPSPTTSPSPTASPSP